MGKSRKFKGNTLKFYKWQAELNVINKNLQLFTVFSEFHVFHFHVDFENGTTKFKFKINEKDIELKVTINLLNQQIYI